MANIEIRGLEDLSETEKQDVQQILEDSYEKIKRKAQTEFGLRVIIKVYAKEPENKEKRKKFSIQAMTSGTGKNFDASAEEWDLHKALHKIASKLENEMEHSFHVSEQRKNDWKR